MMGILYKRFKALPILGTSELVESRPGTFFLTDLFYDAYAWSKYYFIQWCTA